MARRTSDPGRKPLLTDDQRARAGFVPLAKMMPLDWMLRVLRDPDATQARRDRMAVAAAPYCHARLGEKTKKAADAEAAEQAGQGGGWAGDLDTIADGRRPQ